MGTGACGYDAQAYCGLAAPIRLLLQVPTTCPTSPYMRSTCSKLKLQHGVGERENVLYCNGCMDECSGNDCALRALGLPGGWMAEPLAGVLPIFRSQLVPRLCVASAVAGLAQAPTCVLPLWHNLFVMHSARIVPRGRFSRPRCRRPQCVEHAGGSISGAVCVPLAALCTTNAAAGHPSPAHSALDVTHGM